MNPMATSKEEILKTSRVLIQQNGWEAVNIRAVAAACGVSVGCIYNYFGSKTEPGERGGGKHLERYLPPPGRPGGV